MPYSVFHVRVFYPNGKVENHTAQTGGGQLTGTELGKHYVDLNAFPGASRIEITPHEGRAVPLSELVSNPNTRKKLSTTPAAMVNPAVPSNAAQWEPTTKEEAHPPGTEIVAADDPSVKQEDLHREEDEK